MTAEDKQLLGALLVQLQEPISDVARLSTELVDMVQNGELVTKKGISFLDVKNHLMLSYLINLTHLMHEKLSSKTIKESPDVDRLVELRTVLEKMRPVDQKLKFQVERLVRAAKMGAVAEDDPMRLKPNIDNLVEDSDNGSGAEDGEKSKEVYRPAKLAPVYYDGDESVKQKKERQEEMLKKRLARSAAVRELHREYTDAPEEITETPSLYRMRDDRREQERTEYEEKYFVRMTQTKQEKMAARRMNTISGLNSITNFSDISFLSGRERTSGSDKKRKHKSNGKQFKRSSSKKRKFR